MQEKSDVQLLREYARDGDEAAFREIVVRHTDLIYSSALRQTTSPDLAQDVAQSVFTDLARKAQPLANSLEQKVSLLGWLFRSTRFAALNQLRDERRRRARESQAMEILNPAPETAPEWEPLRSVLDAAMAGLSEPDRDALLLRFFKNQDFRTIGESLGVSEDAAQKRVSRALERLRAEFARQGVTTTALALSTTLPANAVVLAPAGLAATLAAAALTGTTVATTATATAVKTIAMTTLQKALITVTIAGVAGGGIYEARQASQLRNQVRTLQQQQGPLAEQIRQSQSERDAATKRLASILEEIANLKGNSAELLRLRGQVGTLRKQAEESARLQRENRALREAQADAQKDQPAEGPACLARASWAFSGYATPEATIQTMTWATGKRDTNALLSSFTPENRERLETNPEELNGVIHCYDLMTGFRVLSKSEPSPGVMALTVDYQVGDVHGVKLVGMKQYGDEWKFAAWNDLK